MGKHIKLSDGCYICKAQCFACMWVETKRCKECRDKSLYRPIYNYCPYCGKKIQTKGG